MAEASVPIAKLEHVDSEFIVAEFEIDHAVKRWHVINDSCS